MTQPSRSPIEQRLLKLAEKAMADTSEDGHDLALWQSDCDPLTVSALSKVVEAVRADARLPHHDLTRSQMEVRGVLHCWYCRRELPAGWAVPPKERPE